MVKFEFLRSGAIGWYLLYVWRIYILLVLEVLMVFVKFAEELFADKIAKTKIACAKAREEMGWPGRKDA